jgi:tetratricopeptide (TPR) repeat protein
MFLRCFLVSLLLAVSQAAAALPAFDEYFKSSALGKVQKKSAKHFTVSWVNPRDEIIADALLEHLQLADKDLDPIFRDQSGERKKVPIEIFPDLRSFSEVSNLSMARFRATGTIALTLDQRLMLLSPRNLMGGYPWAVTVVHEYTHYLIREITAEHIPIWLHEGVAQIFQGYPYIKDWNFEPAQWGLFKKAAQKKKWLDLETLKEPFPYRKDPEEAELAYIEALIFAKWLHQKCGVVNLIRYARDLKGIEPALQKCTAMNVTQLKSRFFSDILQPVKIPDRSDVQFFARDFSGSDPMDVESRKTDKQAKNFAQLSSEEYKQGRYRAACLEMEKAMNISPVHPPSWSRQLALSYQKLSKFDRSRQILESLLRDYPNDAAGWFILGTERLKTDGSKVAWEDFLHAFFVNPFMDGLYENIVELKERNPAFTYSFLSSSQQK